MSAKQTKSELFCKFVKTHVLKPVGLASDAFGEQAQAALDSAQDILTRPGRLHANAPLADLKPGECGTIERLLGSSEGRLRLLEMGMTPGTHVKVIRAAAFGRAARCAGARLSTLAAPRRGRANLARRRLMNRNERT